MVDLEKLGYLIRDAREARKMRQAELGERVGLSRASISLLECGHIKNPKIPLLEALADALSIPRVELFSAAGVSLPDVEGGQVQWLLEELDLPNRRRLVALGHALLQEQKSLPQKVSR